MLKNFMTFCDNLLKSFSENKQLTKINAIAIQHRRYEFCM